MQEMTTKGVSVIRGEMVRLIVHKQEKTTIQTVQKKIMTRIMTMETTTMVGTTIATKMKMNKMKAVIMIQMISRIAMKEIAHLMGVLLVISSQPSKQFKMPLIMMKNLRAVRSTK